MGESRVKRRKKSLKIQKEITDKEKRIIELAKEAWQRSLREYYYPPLNTPNFVFDYTQAESFYIDPYHKWQITCNLANAPILRDDEEYVKYFYAIMLHEVSHYQIIPYDGLINARLLRAAIKRVSPNFAPIVVNVFADLVIDTILYKKYPELMFWELKKTYSHIISNKNNQKLSDFSKFLFHAYETMWNITLTDDDSFTEIDALTNRVTKLILKDFEDDTKWEEKVSKIAYHLKTLLNDTFALIGTGGTSDAGKVKRKIPRTGGYMEIPEEILEIMDNPLENKNSDKLKNDNDDDLRRKAEEFAKDTPYSDFGAPAGQAGLLTDGYPLATWYRGLSKNLVEIIIYEEIPGGQIPIYPEVWRIGNPIEELDIVQTLLNSPIIVPNITTRKWAKDIGPGRLIEKQIPDLLIVLDSSGSMGWNYTAKTVHGRGPYHTALVASFAALHYAASKGVKFSVINFSNRADICQWTSNYQKAEQTLLRYQGGGTFLPLDSILTQCKKADKKVLVFIITDFGIYNWGKAKKIMVDLSEREHKLVGFFIGASSIPKTKFKDLLDKVTFYAIKNVKDLINLVIEEVRKHYS